jgi:xanthine dehydrogenase accessory factor
MVKRSLSTIRELVAHQRLGAVVTIISGPGTGWRTVLEAGRGVVSGELPPEIADDVVSDAEQLMAREQSRTLTYGERSLFVETVAPPPALLVFGAGHTAQPLVTVAKLLGFTVVVADARAAWATEERFPDADEVIVGWPDAVFADRDLDHRTYLVLLSHDPRFEDPVFAAVRGAPVRYLGAVGSRRTHRARLERLRNTGWSDEELARIHGPIGLDIGAETPAEMAVSIMGEVIQARYGVGSGMSLRGTDGPIHPDQPVEEAGAPER